MKVTRLFDDNPVWMRFGACTQAGVDPEVFFPTKELRTAERAKAICHDLCPVRARCLDWALANRLTHGVYGGVGSRERQAMNQQREAA